MSSQLVSLCSLWHAICIQTSRVSPFLHLFPNDYWTIFKMWWKTVFLSMVRLGYSFSGPFVSFSYWVSRYLKYNLSPNSQNFLHTPLTLHICFFICVYIFCSVNITATHQGIPARNQGHLSPSNSTSLTSVTPSLSLHRHCCILVCALIILHSRSWWDMWLLWADQIFGIPSNWYFTFLFNYFLEDGAVWKKSRGEELLAHMAFVKSGAISCHHPPSHTSLSTTNI